MGHKENVGFFRSSLPQKMFFGWERGAHIPIEFFPFMCGGYVFHCCVFIFVPTFFFTGPKIRPRAYLGPSRPKCRQCTQIPPPDSQWTPAYVRKVQDNLLSPIEIVAPFWWVFYFKTG